MAVHAPPDSELNDRESAAVDFELEIVHPLPINLLIDNFVTAPLESCDCHNAEAKT